MGTSVRRSKRTTKNQGPKRLGSPVKHWVKYISADEEAVIKEMALEQYRYGLANVKTDKNKPMETRLKLLERHLFRIRLDMPHWTRHSRGAHSGKCLWRLRNTQNRKKENEKT